MCAGAMGWRRAGLWQCERTAMPGRWWEVAMADQRKCCVKRGHGLRRLDHVRSRNSSAMKRVRYFVARKGYNLRYNSVMTRDAEKAAHDAYWARVDELYPINENWEADGWSTPRFKGTGRRPKCGKWKEDTFVRTRKGSPVFSRAAGDAILPARIVIRGLEVGILFDGQYVYTCNSDEPENKDSWLPYARTPQEWRGFGQGVYARGDYSNGRACLLPDPGERLWAYDAKSPSADPQVESILTTDHGHCGLNLYDVNLPGAKLAHTQLAGARLRGANLEGAILRGSDLTRSFLVFANLKNARMSDARLNRALLDFADLQGAELIRCDFSDAQISSTEIHILQ